MKTFSVIPAAYGATYKVEAEEIAFNKTPGDTVGLVDDKGKVIAVISLNNVAAVFQNT